MLIGCTLPQFGDDPQAVLAAAQRAESAGLAGVFLFDHLWPLGGRDRSILAAWPLLGAVAAVTERLAIGTLVARVGVVSDAQLVHQLTTAERISGGRLIAGLGTGDRLSFAENEAYDIPVEPVARRVERLVGVGGELKRRGTAVWIGGRHPLVRRAALDLAVPLNLWGGSVDEVAEAVRAGHEVTWGGQVLVGDDDQHAAALLARLGPRDGLVHGSVQAVADQLSSLAAAGATWAVCSPLDAGSATAADRLARVARSLSTA